TPCVRCRLCPGCPSAPWWWLLPCVVSLLMMLPAVRTFFHYDSAPRAAHPFRNARGDGRPAVSRFPSRRGVLQLASVDPRSAGEASRPSDGLGLGPGLSLREPGLGRAGQGPLQALAEALLHRGLRLRDEGLFRCGDHAAHHVPADGAPDTGRDVAAVAARLARQILLEQLRLRVAGVLGDLLSHLVFETLESLPRLLDQRLVSLLASGHERDLLSMP